MSVAVFDDLRSQLEGQPDLAGRADALLAGLAERMVTVSNDQNVQRLARELRAAAPQLRAALLGTA